MLNINLLLAWGATYKKVSAGETIFREGQFCNYYYQLVSGNVRWINIDSDGRECIHSIIEPGESFGEFPLFDDGPYAASAIADNDCMLIRLYKPTFLELLKENPDLLFGFTRLLTKRLRFKYSLIKSFASHCPETRIINLINHLKSENKNFCPECDQLKLTRQQIADMTGLRVETVIRTMRQMHEKGDLVISRGKVYCKDMIEVIMT
ncbi:Crp/Fnr family transcriptional regulator [Daejeonella sp. H1SJ63]|uniref:Crp/Fnr family transcriptional regulator n=1 Tax=Daejeonella sp. H1SJ63 TaxID=3034145 RepID=UPI0023EBDF93|nr:Crp/Fnr family transcriptional regulator [Daejeonella sp. H1SJ63]